MTPALSFIDSAEHSLNPPCICSYKYVSTKGTAQRYHYVRWAFSILYRSTHQPPCNCSTRINRKHGTAVSLLKVSVFNIVPNQRARLVSKKRRMYESCDHDTHTSTAASRTVHHISRQLVCFTSTPIQHTRYTTHRVYNIPVQPTNTTYQPGIPVPHTGTATVQQTGTLCHTRTTHQYNIRVEQTSTPVPHTSTTYQNSTMPERHTRTTWYQYNKPVHQPVPRTSTTHQYRRSNEPQQGTGIKGEGSSKTQANAGQRRDRLR